ncbi:MAG: type I methionyl aminopeptidase [Victivallaceae bacterium]|nr:type I methionyl aminopeptidase [Victivallaceae bacterium]
MPRRFVVHTTEEIARIRVAAQKTAQVRKMVADAVRVGMTTLDLDIAAGEIIRSTGGKSAFLGYGAFPGNICRSVNDVVIHGIGSPDLVIEPGDVVSVDVGVSFDGAVGDCATTVVAGGASGNRDVDRLLSGTVKALQSGIHAARHGVPVGAVSAAVETEARRNHLGIVMDYVGHGCGIELHEPPEVPNYTGWGQGPTLVPGMVICIEPMLTLGRAAVKVDRADGWTVRTRDGSLSAHFEEMVLITDREPEVLTWQKTM